MRERELLPLEHESSPAPMRGFFASTVGRPVALMVIFVSLIVLGVISYRRIPLQLFPSEFTEPELNVWIPNPDGTARENEEQIARPIEEQLRTLSGIEEIESFSEPDYVMFDIDFDGTVDMDLARAEVRDRLERAWPGLPDTAENASMWSESADSLPITFFGITVKGESARRDYLMQKVVIPRLEAVSGIGKVDVWGVLQDSIRIMLDEDKVAAAQLDLGAIITRLSSDNFALPMGEINDGGREIILRSDMRFTSPEEIGEFPIGGGLKLKDVGRVARVKSVSNQLTRIDGAYAYYGMATKDSQSNVVETSRNFEETVRELERDPALSGTVAINLFFIQGDFIESALSQLRSTAIWGGLLAVVVLFVFLRRIRLTLCVALSIPVSALFAISFEYFTGGSFNLLTMTGITLGIGMLVDNAVVVVENIARLHRQGIHAHRAAVIGTRQIALAITLATLTTVVVFLPLIFMTENPQIRVIFGNLGIPLSISLLASLLVAVVFLPVIAARLMGERPSWMQGGAGALARVTVLPVRAVAYGAGLLRAVFYGLLWVVHRLNRVALAALRIAPVRWLLAAGVAAAAFLQWKALEAALGHSSNLDEFGVSLGVAPDDRAKLLMSAIALPAAGAIALLLLGAKRWAQRPARPPARPDNFVPAGNSLVDMVVALNHRLVSWVVTHRLAAFGLALLFFASIGFPASNMKLTAFGQDEVSDSASFWVEFDANFTLGEAEEELLVYEELLDGYREEWDIEHVTMRYNERSGYFAMYFERRKPEDEVDALEKELEASLPRIPGHKLHFYRQQDASAGGKSNEVARFILRGPDSRELERLGAEAERVLEEVPGLSQVSSPLTEAPDQIEVIVDREKAHGLGITSEAIQSTIAYTLRGWPLPRYQEEGRDLPLLIEYDEDEVAGLPTLRDLAVWSDQASSVQLSAFADLNFGKGTRRIYRRDGQTSFTLEAKVEDPLRVIPITESAYAALASIDLPRGYSWDMTDSARSRQQDEFAELRSAFMLSVVLVFLLMAILFESVLLPFSVLFTIPFAVMGALWTLFLTGTALDSMGWIGIIILAGVVVNNGIVLIDRIHGLRAGLSRSEAVISGCAQRVRPVLMTALTTVCGLLPMAISEPPTSSMIDYRSLATIVAGGLIASTFFTLWVVPLAYTVFDDLARILMGQLAWWVERVTQRGKGNRGSADGPSGDLRPAVSAGGSGEGLYAREP